MAFALYVKTESGDNYVYAFDGTPSTKEIVKKIKEEMGDEFDYICTYEYDSTYDIRFKMKLS